MKKKMDAFTKMKLIYSIELAVIALVALVIGILELTSVIHIKDVVITIFNWVTLFGGTIMVIDFIWTMTSPKKRAKSSLIDKFLMLPLGLYLIVFDLVVLIANYDKEIYYDIYKYCIGCALLYLAVIYLFQAIYHWKHPVPALLQELAAAEDEQKAKLEDGSSKEEDNKDSSTEENTKE